MSDGVTCCKCSGRIDARAFEMKRKVWEKLGKPPEPPKLCSDCMMLALFTFAHSNDDDAPAAEKGK